jgi:hypothetical protein
MTIDEIHLLLGYLALKAKQEREAMEKARRGSGSGGGKFKPVVNFKRPAK